MGKRKFSPKNVSSHSPKSKKEEQEFGPGKEDLLVCKKCDAVYFYKSWHHRFDDYPFVKESKALRFGFCPACQMIKDGKFEGEIKIENVSEKIKEQLINTIKNIGDEGFKRDSQDRIIKVEERKPSKKLAAKIEGGNKEIHILTTENQLAVRIAKKIAQTFKGKIEISYSRQESTTRINVFL